jgi:hypothetical protein
LHHRTASARPEERSQSGDRREIDHAENDVSRRDALISIGKYAAYVTPAMTVLVRGSTSLANHSCNSGDDGQGNAHSCVP